MFYLQMCSFQTDKTLFNQDKAQRDVLLKSETSVFQIQVVITYFAKVSFVTRKYYVPFKLSSNENQTFVLIGE